MRSCILTSLVQKACGFGLLRRTYMVACLPGQSGLCFSVCIFPPAAGFLFSLQIPRMGAQAGPHGFFKPGVWLGKADGCGVGIREWGIFPVLKNFMHRRHLKSGLSNCTFQMMHAMRASWVGCWV